MVAVGINRQIAPPGIKQALRLIQKRRPFRAPDPCGDWQILHAVVDRAFAPCLIRIKAQRFIHRRVQQRRQIAQRRNRHHAGDALRPIRPHITARHPRHQMPARRMPDQIDRPRRARRNHPDRLVDFTCNLHDPRLRTESVGRHRAGHAPRQSPGRQMAEHARRSGQPIPAMYKNDRSHCATRRAKQIIGLARTAPIRHAQIRIRPSCAKRGGIGLPPRVVSFPVGDIGGICIGFVRCH